MELTYPPVKKTAPTDIKLRIEEKINLQVLGCDITASPNTKFDRIRTMYCKHRQYKKEEYMFAVDGVLIEPIQTLEQLGLTSVDKSYLINVYHRAVVNISN
jgi:hypothetical protein